MDQKLGYEAVGLEKEFVEALHVLNNKAASAEEKRRAIGSMDRLSAEGNIRSTVLLGILYENGDFVSQDLEKAKGYFEKATFLGAVNGEYQLGLLLLQDNKLRNVPLGVQHIRNAASKGLKEALFSLGDIYLKGIGVEANEGEAMRFYRLAADRGYGIAYYELAKLESKNGQDEKAKEDLEASKAHGYDIASGKQDFLRQEYLHK